MTDAEALDGMSAWLCGQVDDAQATSPWNFLELAAELIDATGRPTLPWPQNEPAA